MINSGLPFFDILLTWQGILNYTLHKVLKRPHIAEHNTPVSSAFFSSIDFMFPKSISGTCKVDSLWPSVGVIKDLIRQGIYQPSICGFEHLAAFLSKRLANFKITYRRY